MPKRGRAEGAARALVFGRSVARPVRHRAMRAPSARAMAVLFPDDARPWALISSEAPPSLLEGLARLSKQFWQHRAGRSGVRVAVRGRCPSARRQRTRACPNLVDIEPALVCGSCASPSLRAAARGLCAVLRGPGCREGLDGVAQISCAS
eukprot:6399329-Lingulodinium_polyedra.AAC.1